MRRALIASVAGLFLVGCGKHYWNKPGASFADFSRDSGACAQENALYTGANKAYGIVHVDFYRACLRGHGWVRAQVQDPPPPDWFRGIEDDSIVRLDAPPPQPSAAAVPSVSTSSNVQSPSDPTLAVLAGTWTGTLTGPAPPTVARRVYPATLQISEEGGGLRWSLAVSGSDLGGSGVVVRSEQGTSLSGSFGQPAVPISFSVIMSGSTLEANGLGADNWVYRLAVRRQPR